MSFYERYPASPPVKTDMPDLPMKARHPDLNKPLPPKRLSQKKRELMSKPLPPKRRTTTKRPVKPLPPMKHEEQPRDRLGRFARKTGAVLWGGAKATGRAVVGTARGVKRAHKSVKRMRADARRRGRLEERERRIALAEREKKLGLRKKTVKRRRKR